MAKKSKGSTTGMPVDWEDMPMNKGGKGRGPKGPMVPGSGPGAGPAKGNGKGKVPAKGKK